jgi:hypothetical protein
MVRIQSSTWLWASDRVMSKRVQLVKGSLLMQHALLAVVESELPVTTGWATIIILLPR